VIEKNRFAGIFLSAVLLLSGTEAASSKHDPVKVRDTLFKCKILLNKNCNEVLFGLLKKINFTKNNEMLIPSLAICSLKHTGKPSKADREMFLKSMAASVNCVNKIITEHRRFVINVRNKKFRLTPREKEHFRMICEFYGTSKIDELLVRIAPVPVSLAVAQAALESGFGSDKHIHLNNAFFGMMKNSRQLYSFDSVFESTIAYAKTLNVNGCYRNFRKQRSSMIRNLQKIDGVKLSGYLQNYYVSKVYRQQVLTLIKEYSLDNLDRRLAA
jgi:uncharacterized FlgJ-related protein